MPSAADDIRELTARIRAFSEARDWEPFHRPKNLAMALAVEVAELMELFQWLTPEEADAVGSDAGSRSRLESELADVAIYLLRIADVLSVDLGAAVADKIEANERRFPIERIRGRATLPEGGAP